MIPTAQPGPSLRSQRANISSTLAASSADLPPGGPSARRGAHVASSAMRRTAPTTWFLRRRAAMWLLLGDLSPRAPFASWLFHRHAHGRVAGSSSSTHLLLWRRELFKVLAGPRVGAEPTGAAATGAASCRRR